MNTILKVSKVIAVLMVVVAMTWVSGWSRDKNETIDATAYGTSTQLGQKVDVILYIEQLSTPEERQTLVDAFTSSGQNGLVKALEKMTPKGRIRTPAGVGNDIKYLFEVA